MSKVFIFEYDVLKERVACTGAALMSRSCARLLTSGGEFNHLSIVFEKEYSYCGDGLITLHEPVCVSCEFLGHVMKFLFFLREKVEKS